MPKPPVEILPPEHTSVGERIDRRGAETIYATREVVRAATGFVTKLIIFFIAFGFFLGATFVMHFTVWRPASTQVASTVSAGCKVVPVSLGSNAAKFILVSPNNVAETASFERCLALAQVAAGSRKMYAAMMANQHLYDTVGVTEDNVAYLPVSTDGSATIYVSVKGADKPLVYTYDPLV